MPAAIPVPPSRTQPTRQYRHVQLPTTPCAAPASRSILAFSGEADSLCRLSMPAKSKLLVVDVAALGWNLVSHLPDFRPVQSIFPAVTCPVQAAFRTATTAGENGLVANGLFFSD